MWKFVCVVLAPSVENSIAKRVVAGGSDIYIK